MRAVARRAVSNRCSCSAWSTSHGLNAHGVVASETARSAGSTHFASTTSRGLSTGSASVRAVYTGHSSCSTMPLASVAR